ncbi:transmembrane protein, putative, partial [Bodo saltans]
MDDQSFVKLGSNQLRAGDHSVVVFFTSVIPLFSSLTSFESTEPQLLVVAGIIVYVFQHIGFLINAHFSDVLGYILGGDIANIFYGFHFPLYDPLFVYDAKPTSLIALVYVTFALGLLLVTLTMFYRTTGSDTDKKNPAFVLVNRLVLHGMSTFLLIPMLQVCLAGMVCGDQWSLWHYAGRSNVDQSTIQCWGSNHLATFIPSALFTAAILPMIYLTIGCQFETRNSSDHLKARRNSFVDEIVFAHDVISCVLFQVLLAYNQRGAFAIVHAASAFVVSGAHAYYLPFYDLNMNQFFAAVHAVEGAISVIVAAALLNPSFAMSASASAMIIGLAPFAALYAAVLAAYRVHPLFVHLMQQCKSGVRPYLETSKVPFPKGLADDTNFAPFPDLEEQVVECVTRQDAHAATEDLKRPPLGGGGGGRDGRDSVSGGEGWPLEMDPAKRQCEILAPFIEVVRVPADVDLAASFPQVFERVMGDKPTLRMLVVASKIFSRGIVTFPNNSFILYRFASFIVEYIPTMSFVGLELIENMSHIVDTSIILRYRAYHTAQELRMALGIRNQAHLLHSKRARQKHSGVLTLMHSFWMKLTEPSVNIGQVSEIADQINGSRQEALAQFRRALQHQTTSDALLVHRMGDFLRDIMMDHEGATECHNEAKEIHEARQARSMRGTKQHTTVELDVETLTDRLMTLLEGKRDNNANSSAGHSGVVQYLLFGVTIIFLALLAISALFLYVSIDQHTKMNNSVEHIQRMAGLRHEANQFGASLLGALAATTTATRAPFFTLMAQELSTFSSEFAAVTSGEYQTKHKPQVQLLTDAMVPAYIDTPFGDSNSGYALWTLTEQLISHMKTIVQYGNTTTLSNNDPHVKFVLDATMPTSYSYDYMVSLAEGYISDESSTVTIWSIVLMVVGVVIVVLTYLAFLVSFRRTALSRIFTFQLFTLIPFDDLEKLAS